ncbi:conserved hypothetical protein [Planctopirus limnophila DSM 3776]|jgi:uncharacterized protein (DUF58 family)|uniref:DUF58 domain-containing protein n=3 Tax=Planctopirus TaxID=1649480 RepID=D5SVI4_PLAL2|nr:MULTISPECIES: DUF58 domain-containing protein [Planctopirus]ADG67254.1 conserved hypothetical protein [Planctopirus limnophila DSM 3776]ODA31180.1 hypothetical protein A6X21_22720 [Planctopirus hydrillae]QDV30192.1 hypothetical protein Spb1_21200 [Planctopirus ephydatiae]
MAGSLLSRYLDAETLGRVADRTIEPRGMVLGNLAGAHKSPLCGFAVEFASHREYVLGDDVRHIDWRLYYKRDRYFIKQYEMETNFVAHLILDISASMRYGDGLEQKLAYAAQLATTLGYSIVRQNDKVSLATFDNRVRGSIPAGNSMSQIIRMARHLDECDAVDKTDMASCLSQLNSRFARREIIMIFSDFLTDVESLEPVLQRMRYNNHEVVLFHVLHHHEVAFDFTGMVKFKGLELPEEYLTQTEDVRREYLAAFNEYLENFKQMCLRNRIEHIVMDTRIPVAETLIDYLNRRSLVKAIR